MKITCKIWQNTPNSLIDFESDENTSFTTTIDKKGILYRKGNNLELDQNNHINKSLTKANINNNEQDVNTNKGTFLCKIYPEKEYYEIKMNEKDEGYNVFYDIDSIPWIVSRYVFDNQVEHGYKMHEGDLFKLGKYILRVREIRLKKDNLGKTMTMVESNKIYKEEDISRNIINPSISQSLFQSNNNLIYSKEQKDLLLLLNKNKNDKKEKEKEKEKEKSNISEFKNSDVMNNKPTCRICLCEDYDDDNPLINPCKCNGTMKYLHLECLRKLIESKVTKSSNEITTIFTFKTLSCDICKSLFPENIKIKKKTFNIINLERPESNYLILEGIIKESTEQKSIFLVNIKDKNIKIGRASDADIRLSDISVSRAHANISLFNGCLILNDTKSKFGTLINAGNHFVVLYNKPISIQKGNIFLRFLMKKKLCSILTCYRPSKVPFQNYNSFFDTIEGKKCQIKDIDNFLRTETQEVSEYEENNIMEKEDIKKKERNSSGLSHFNRDYTNENLNNVTADEN